MRGPAGSLQSLTKNIVVGLRSTSNSNPNKRRSPRSFLSFNLFKMNRPTASPTTRKKSSRLVTGWDLLPLIQPQTAQHAKPRRHRPAERPHYPAVVEYVHQSRFAIRTQIQRRFPQWLASERTARYQLARLVELGYLATAPVTSTSPTFPIVYLATIKGVKLVKKTWSEHGILWEPTANEEKRERGRALQSILHELLCTEFELAVRQSIAGAKGLQLLATERRYYRKENRLHFTYQTTRRDVVPDAGFVLGASGPEGRRQLLLHLVELDNGTMHPPRILEKYQLYAAWSASPEGKEYLTKLYRRLGAQHPKPNFRLLVIAHDKRQYATQRDGGDGRRLLDLYTQALSDEVWPALRDRLWFTTAEQLRGHQYDRRPLDAAIWLRARDAKSWLRAYRAHVASTPRRAGHKLYAQQRKFVAERLPALPKHVLFPRPA